MWDQKLDIGSRNSDWISDLESRKSKSRKSKSRKSKSRKSKSRKSKSRKSKSWKSNIGSRNLGSRNLGSLGSRISEVGSRILSWNSDWISDLGISEVGLEVKRSSWSLSTQHYFYKKILISIWENKLLFFFVKKTKK